MLRVLRIGSIEQTIKFEEELVLSDSVEEVEPANNETVLFDDVKEEELILVDELPELLKEQIKKSSKKSKKIKKLKKKKPKTRIKRGKIMDLEEFSLKCDCEVLGDYYKDVRYVSTYYLK